MHFPNSKITCKEKGFGLQQTLLTFTVQDFSQGSEEKQSCISSTNGCDCLWHQVIVCLFPVNQTLGCLTRVWSLATVTQWVNLFFTFCYPWFWLFRLTLIFSCQIKLPFGSVWFDCKIINFRTMVNNCIETQYYNNESKENWKKITTMLVCIYNCTWDNMFKQLWNILLQPVMLGYFSFLPDSPFKQENWSPLIAVRISPPLFWANSSTVSLLGIINVDLFCKKNTHNPTQKGL